MLHLRAPLRIYCLCQAKNTQIERKVGYINKFTVSAECRTGREKQSLRRAGTGEAFKIAEPGKQFAGGADDVDFVILVGGHPEVVMRVNGNSVCAIDAVDEQDWFSGRAMVHRNLHNRVIAGVGDKQSRLGVIEFQTVRTERRHASRSKQSDQSPMRFPRRRWRRSSR